MAYNYFRTIHLADTDAAGVVYFATLLHICHEAYEICLAEVGMDWQSLLTQGELAIPIVHGEIDFFAPIRWGDRLEIKLYPAPQADHRFEVTYQVWRSDAGSSNRPLATAITHHVAIQSHSRKATFLPSEIQQWLRNTPKVLAKKT